MAKIQRNSGTTHTQKVIMMSIYDNMQKYPGISFQSDHKPYQFPIINKEKKEKSNV